MPTLNCGASVNHNQVINGSLFDLVAAVRQARPTAVNDLCVVGPPNQRIQGRKSQAIGAGGS